MKGHSLGLPLPAVSVSKGRDSWCSVSRCLCQFTRHLSFPYN